MDGWMNCTFFHFLMQLEYIFIYHSASSDSALPIQFHITLLQILVMLAAESEVMSKKV